LKKAKSVCNAHDAEHEVNGDILEALPGENGKAKNVSDCAEKNYQS